MGALPVQGLQIGTVMDNKTRHAPPCLPYALAVSGHRAVWTLRFLSG